MISVPMTVSTAEPVAMNASSDQTVQMGMGAMIAPVRSVNGKTGAVVLNAEDVGALPSDTTLVTSVNGQSGVVTISADDVIVVQFDEITEKATMTASEIFEAVFAGKEVLYWGIVILAGFYLRFSAMYVLPNRAVFADVVDRDDYSVTIMKVVIFDDGSVTTMRTTVPLTPSVTSADAGKFIVVNSDGHLAAVEMEAWEGGEY